MPQVPLNPETSKAITNAMYPKVLDRFKKLPATAKLFDQFKKDIDKEIQTLKEQVRSIEDRIHARRVWRKSMDDRKIGRWKEINIYTTEHFRILKNGEWYAVREKDGNTFIGRWKDFSWQVFSGTQTSIPTHVAKITST